jgi:hypothetical protein
MKKLMLFTILSTLFINSYSQDTTCTMVSLDEVLEFNYQTDEVIDREDYKGTVLIEVGYREVLCLHLYDKKKRKRKVIVTYPDGEQVVQRLDSKSNVYFTQIGPLTVEVQKSKHFSLNELFQSNISANNKD